MVSVISGIIQWVIVPGVMLALLVFAMRIAGQASGSELRTSAWAGFWAGLVMFVIYIVGQLSHLHGSAFDLSTLPGLLIGPAALGFVTGFVFLWMVRLIVPTRLVGVITLLLSGTSSSSLFTYVFVDSLRTGVLYWVLGIALGILLHLVLFPGSVEGLFD